MGKGMFRMSPVLLAEMLHLPEGTRIVQTEWTMKWGHPEIMVAIEHANLPEAKEGEPWPEVEPTYKRTAQHDHVKFVGWGVQSRLERLIDTMPDELKKDAVVDIDLEELMAEL